MKDPSREFYFDKIYFFYEQSTYYPSIHKYEINNDYHTFLSNLVYSILAANVNETPINIIIDETKNYHHFLFKRIKFE